MLLLLSDQGHVPHQGIKPSFFAAPSWAVLIVFLWRFIHYRSLVAALAALCMALFGILPVCAQSVDVFPVRGVKVDVTAANVTLARDQAMADGQRQAFVLLTQRLTAAADWTRLPVVSDQDLQDLILDVGIEQEKRSSVRYIASIGVRFKAEAVRSLLRSAGIAYAEWRGRPIAVLPVYQIESGPILWEPQNPWRDAWKSTAAQGVVPLVVPAAPSADQITLPLSATQAAQGSPDTLAAVSQRYNTADVIIAVAALGHTDDGKIKVDVTLIGSGPVGALASGPRSVQGDAGEPAESVLRRAVADVSQTVNDGYKAGNLLQFDHSATLAVLVPLNGSLADWTTLRDNLTRSTAVRSYEVAALSRMEASLVLHYVGDQRQLESVFVQNGLVLSWAGDHWILQNAASHPAGR